jgi:hypothetical protein
MRAIQKAICATAVLMAAVASGCGGPLVVSAAESRGDNIKFAYTRMGTGEQGLVECTVPADGDLTDCRHMKINFQE